MVNDYLPLRYWGKLLSILVIMSVFCLTTLAQQQITVSGKVQNTKNEPLSGASVGIKGTNTGVLTNAEGEFTISCKSNSVLVFSYSGYQTQEKAVNGTTNWTIQLEEGQSVLSEVVVTALGVERKSGQVTYATQKINGSELTKVPETNFINTLSGKVAGVSIQRNASGVGGSAKVLIRGNKSAQGNNQPLYVINGVPISNNVSENINQSFSSFDNGDGISNLNPADIESINVLKGASAAALYGSRAANGVILITTKKGKAGVSTIDFSSSFTADKVAYLPELQNSFGQTAPGSEESWGGPITNAPDNISGFFRTGKTWVNSISLSSGNEKMRTYFSYSNTTGNGVLRDNKLTRHNLSLRQTARYLNDKLSLDANVNIIKQDMHNPPMSGFQATQLYGLYGFPRGMDMTPYKNYERFDSVRNVITQNWPFITASNQNPYWVANKNLFDNKRNRSLINLVVKYDITDWLNFQLRGNMDRTNDVNTKKYYVGTAVAYGGQNGGYNLLDRTITEYYGDAILSANKTFEKFSFNVLAGSSITDSRINGESAGSTLLYIPNVFTIQNMNPLNGGYASSLSEGRQQLQAVFGSANLTYNNGLSLDVTGRHDWSSNLSYTPNGSYFYPSAGLSAILTEALKLPEIISYAKLRASYAIVGNTVPLYVTNPLNYLDGRGNVNFNNRAPFSDLKPEQTRSFEAGAELQLFKNQFNLDFTYYKTNTVNQFFSIAVPPGTGYSQRYINGGDIQNTGFEITAGYTSLPGTRLRWSTTANFSTNRNLIKKLATEVEQFVITSDINNYYSILKVGGSYGDLFGQVAQRDAKGRMVIDADGKPVIQQGEPAFVGNSNPKFKLGINNNFSYKNFILSFLVDGSFGGKVMSLSQQMLDGLGVSKASGEARLNGGVKVNGVQEGTEDTEVTLVDPKKYYQTIGGIQRATGEYMYDATTVRLREVTLGYSLPSSVLKNGFFKNARLSLVGRNLIYFYKPAPFDSDIIFSNGNGYSGVEILSLPATRSFGFNLNLTF
ncbi:MAG: SusC/RagA family TonB-linked outer membrane protein [Agriterribacter sp.]